MSHLLGFQTQFIMISKIFQLDVQLSQLISDKQNIFSAYRGSAKTAECLVERTKLNSNIDIHTIIIMETNTDTSQLFVPFKI